MVNTQTNLGKAVYLTRWTARLLSFTTSSIFLLITFLAVTNEDRPQPPAIPVLALLVLTILACLIAWRWEKVGGGLVVIGAISLGIVAYSAASAFGLGAFAFLISLIYSLPFLAVGVLFLLIGQVAKREAIA
jgi:hypothetical protein